MRDPRSLIWSVAAPSFAAVLAAMALGGLALGWSLTQTIEKGLRGEIALDIAAIRQNEERLRVVAIADAIDHRIAAAPATSAGLYLLVDRDGTAITGNLAGMPSSAVEGDWLRFTEKSATGSPARWLGRKQELANGYTLLVARRADGHWATLRAASPALAAILLGCLLLVSVVLSRTSQRVRAAVSELNGVIAAARSGAPERRLVATGQPRELEQLGQQINVLLDTIDRQLANMRRLSTQAAHELSTPLARVVARLRHAPDQGAITRCCEELEETMAVLQMLLDLAEHESEPGVAAQVLDLASVCASVCDIYADAAADREIVLARSLSPAPVRGEASLLTRAVANLLDNALKASPSGTVVMVATGMKPTLSFLSVTDEGPGVAGLSIDDLLIAARERPRTPGSHGLGLRFTRAIALRHGAVLTVAPGAARGSVFTLAFPNGAS